MGETRVTATAVIPVPPDRLWELLSDTSRYAEWVDGTDEVTHTDGPASEGSTYDEVNPVMGPWKARTHWTVEEFDPPRRQVHRGQGIPLTKGFLVEMEVRPAGDGSEVTQTLRAEPGAGPLGALFHRLMRGQVERDNRKSVENLAALAGRELGQPAAT